MSRQPQAPGPRRGHSSQRPPQRREQAHFLGQDQDQEQLRHTNVDSTITQQHILQNPFSVPDSLAASSEPATFTVAAPSTSSRPPDHPRHLPGSTRFSRLIPNHGTLLPALSNHSTDTRLLGGDLRVSTDDDVYDWAPSTPTRPWQRSQYATRPSRTSGIDSLVGRDGDEIRIDPDAELAELESGEADSVGGSSLHSKRKQEDAFQQDDGDMYIGGSSSSGSGFQADGHEQPTAFKKMARARAWAALDRSHLHQAGESSTAGLSNVFQASPLSTGSVIPNIFRTSSSTPSGSIFQTSSATPADDTPIHEPPPLGRSSHLAIGSNREYPATPTARTRGVDAGPPSLLSRINAGRREVALPGIRLFGRDNEIPPWIEGVTNREPMQTELEGGSSLGFTNRSLHMSRVKPRKQKQGDDIMGEELDLTGRSNAALNNGMSQEDAGPHGKEMSAEEQLEQLKTSLASSSMEPEKKEQILAGWKRDLQKQRMENEMEEELEYYEASSFSAEVESVEQDPGTGAATIKQLEQGRFEVLTSAEELEGRSWIFEGPRVGYPQRIAR